ncbi:DUF805 domain-containing protein [Paenibacillus chibensis]|uniref:DUF805 domain-containing protein n=1 Tax=Paenibacillus chibensis TaxID=59846 RepID=UPI000FD8898E|nr:DUF805 domain-containing protein [Paenibacillus chibensis]MEC0371830.1 DUF805 domain-containing protein [Paenibacillus chibensis]
MIWYFKVLKNYIGFQGRARRQEYWMFTLISGIISIALSLYETFRGLSSGLSWVYTLAVFMPTLAVTVRRLHDTGKSGFWFFINFLPIVGTLILLIFTCQDSEEDENQYGPNPKKTA